MEEEGKLRRRRTSVRTIAQERAAGHPVDCATAMMVTYWHRAAAEPLPPVPGKRLHGGRSNSSMRPPNQLAVRTESARSVHLAALARCCPSLRRCLRCLVGAAWQAESRRQTSGAPAIETALGL